MDGTLIAGRYRRRERLGAGGMASVWGARDERTGQDVAVKVLHPHLAGDDRQRGRLRHEAAALASIDDEHVVPVLDVVDDGHVTAIVMPRVDGETLADRLHEAGTLGEGEALEVAIAVAEALAAAHAVGLIHRDVKPSNILLGSDGLVRLMDFGIAADLDATTELTAEGVVGTLRYLAPERLLGEPAVPATDVWGLGIVLLEMLAGRPAFPGAGLGDRIEAAGDPILRPAAASDTTWAVIRRAADGDPARRYPNGAVLLAALREAKARAGAFADDDATAVVPIATGPPATDPAMPAQVHRPLVSGPRMPTVVAAALAVLLVAGMAIAVVALDPGPGGGTAGDAPAAAPILSDRPAGRTPSPDPTAAPAMAEDGAKDEAKEDEGEGQGQGKGGGHDDDDKGKGKGKDKS